MVTAVYLWCRCPDNGNPVNRQFYNGVYFFQWNDTVYKLEQMVLEFILKSYLKEDGVSVAQKILSLTTQRSWILLQNKHEGYCYFWIKNGLTWSIVKLRCYGMYDYQMMWFMSVISPTVQFFQLRTICWFDLLFLFRWLYNQYYSVSKTFKKCAKNVGTVWSVLQQRLTGRYNPSVRSRRSWAHLPARTANLPS